MDRNQRVFQVHHEPKLLLVHHDLLERLIPKCVLELIDYYLPVILPLYQLTSEPLFLVAFILIIAAIAFAGIAVIVAIFGTPKALWVIFAFLTLACILVMPIIGAIQGGGFQYIDPLAYQLLPLDFIGFWVGVGGAFLAMIVGLFVPTD